MITKKARQARIIEIISERSVGSQDDLSELLRGDGVEIAQATVSRDIRELGLVKVRGCYQATTDTSPVSSSSALRSIFAQFITRTDTAGNIVVIRTSSGGAHSVCAALDAVGWPEVVGTIAGDDTIFVLARDAGQCGKLLEKIRDALI